MFNPAHDVEYNSHVIQLPSPLILSKCNIETVLTLARALTYDVELN